MMMIIIITIIIIRMAMLTMTMTVTIMIMVMMMMMTMMMMMMMMMMMIVGTYGDYSSKSVPVSITTLTYEQKGCREKSRGTKDQLPIDRAILRDFK